MRAQRRIAVLTIVAAVVSGCAASLAARNPVPDGTTQARAAVRGLPGIRFWADEVPVNPAAAFRRAVPDLPRLAVNARRSGGRPVVEILALSGGGGDGAFGAGILAGWTASGSRPEFEVVTGVSAGAIIAPFAFLGPRYDGVLKEIWTTYSTRDIGTVQGLQGIVGGDAVIETSGLAQLIEKYLTSEVIEEIGRQYQRGRILMVLTTNLDAQRPVVWNLGALAQSRHPQARQLFHKIILASAAIPGALSPVRIAVEANGQIYDELHVDGGTTREIFISPAQVPLRSLDRLYERPPIRRIYLIKNGRSEPVYGAVDQKTLSIAGRAIQTLILSQSAGEIYRIYRRTLDAGADFNFAAIPDDFPYVASELFDAAYQKKLFETGEQQGRRGGFWLKRPPDVTPDRAKLVSIKLKPVPGAAVRKSDAGFEGIFGAGGGN